jgi:N,N'-diacetylchitobiose transport system substrate-binding protein
MTRSRRSWAVAIVALVLAVSACGGAEGDSRHLTVWIMDPGSPTVEQILDRAARDFESRHDGLTVTLEFLPWTRAHERLETAAGAGQLPDLAEMTTSWTPEFAASGVLDELVPLDGLTPVPALLAAGTFGGASYGYPWYGGARSLVYRTDILDDVGVGPPATWTELLSVGERIAAAEVDVAPLHVAGEYAHWFVPLIWGAGGEIASEQDGSWTPGVDSDAGRAAFAHYQRLWETGWTPDEALSWTSVDVREAFAGGRSAMMIAAGWDLAAVLEGNPDLRDRVGVALLPAGPAGVRDAYAGGSHLVVSATSTERELAHEFARWLVDPERAAGVATEIGFLPGTAEGVRAAVGHDDLYRTFGTQLVDHSRSYPPAVWWSRIDSDRVLVHEMQRLLRGEQTVNEAVTAVDTAIRAAAG